MRNCVYSYVLYSKAGLSYHNGPIEGFKQRKAQLIKDCDENPVLGKVREQLTGADSYYVKPMINMTCLLFDRDFWLLPECVEYDGNPYATQTKKIGQPTDNNHSAEVYGAIVWGSRGVGMALIDGYSTSGTETTSANIRYAPLEEVDTYWASAILKETFKVERFGDMPSLSSLSKMHNNPFSSADAGWLKEVPSEGIAGGLKDLEEAPCFKHFKKEDFDEMFHSRQMDEGVRAVLNVWLKKHSERLDIPAEKVVE